MTDQPTQKLALLAEWDLTADTYFPTEALEPFMKALRQALHDQPLAVQPTLITALTADAAESVIRARQDQEQQP